MRRLGQPFKKPNSKAWWLRWTDPVTKKRPAKSFPTKKLADHFRNILYYRLNTDVFIGVINIRLSQAIKEYLDRYDLRNLSKASKIDVQATLNRFIKFTGDTGTKSLSQQHFDSYLRWRKNSISPWTLNKDIGNLKALVNWACKARYINIDIELRKIKTPRIQHKALTTEQIRCLFSRCPSPAWRCRILLSLVTGLRRADVDGLALADLDLKAATLDTHSQKTGKTYIGRPLPTSAMPELRSYVEQLPDGQAKLFTDKNVRKEWDKIRNGSGITRQDFRRTFSTLIQRTGSIGSAQNLLEHYDSRTTTDFYTDTELILRWKVNQLPVAAWLEHNP